MVQQHTAKGQPLEGRAAERGALCLGNNHKQPSKRVWIRLSVAGKSLFLWKFPLGCLTKAGRDSTLKKKIELQQEQDEKDSQKIGRLRTSNGKEALRYDAVFL